MIKDYIKTKKWIQVNQTCKEKDFYYLIRSNVEINVWMNVSAGVRNYISVNINSMIDTNNTPSSIKYSALTSLKS